MKIILDDQALDQMAKEYHNGYTKAGTPLYNVMSFEKFIDRRRKNARTKASHTQIGQQISK